MTARARPTRPAAGCLEGVCEPERTQGLRAPAPKGEHLLVHLRGPGLFLGAEVTKQGGASGITFVSLEIDGRNVVSLSYAAAHNAGLTQANPFGIVLLQGVGIQNFTIGFPAPLRFRSELRLSAIVNEDGIAQIVANVVHGK
jgi:hypothetical protein